MKNRKTRLIALKPATRLSPSDIDLLSKRFDFYNCADEDEYLACLGDPCDRRAVLFCQIPDMYPHYDDGVFRVLVLDSGPHSLTREFYSLGINVVLDGNADIAGILDFALDHVEL